MQLTIVVDHTESSSMYYLRLFFVCELFAHKIGTSSWAQPFIRRRHLPYNRLSYSQSLFIIQQSIYFLIKWSYFGLSLFFNILWIVPHMKLSLFYLFSTPLCRRREACNLTNLLQTIIVYHKFSRPHGMPHIVMLLNRINIYILS